MNSTTLALVLQAFADTAQAALVQPDAVHVGDASIADIQGSARLAVFPRGDIGVDQDGFSRRTASVTVKLIAVDDPTDDVAGATQLIRLVERFEPVYYAILADALAKTNGFTDMDILVQDDHDQPGIVASGFDSHTSDRYATIGANFIARYNRTQP